ncbi:MAG: response regulator [Calditrichaeota bacterium]|nr:response regulator [Calditrichota bacterium]
MIKGALILIVDDEIQIRRMLRLSLEGHGFLTCEATTAQEGLAAAAAKHPDIVILDLGLPDKDGLEVVKNLREWTNTPIIVLTIRDSEEDKIALLDAGANDYIVKPFGMGELLARIRVILRNMIPEKNQKILNARGIRIDLSSRVVTKNEIEIKLTPTEYAILRLLAINAGKVLTHSQIMKELWADVISPDASYLRVYMFQLRRKLEDDPEHPEVIVTEPGIGYILRSP